MTLLWGDSIEREFRTLQSAYFADPAPPKGKAGGRAGALKVSSWPSAPTPSPALPGVAMFASVTGANPATFTQQTPQQHAPRVKGSGKFVRAKVRVGGDGLPSIGSRAGTGSTASLQPPGVLQSSLSQRDDASVTLHDLEGGAPHRQPVPPGGSRRGVRRGARGKRNGQPQPQPQPVNPPAHGRWDAAAAHAAVTAAAYDVEGAASGSSVEEPADPAAALLGGEMHKRYPSTTSSPWHVPPPKGAAGPTPPEHTPADAGTSSATAATTPVLALPPSRQAGRHPRECIPSSRGLPSSRGASPSRPVRSMNTTAASWGDTGVAGGGDPHGTLGSTGGSCVSPPRQPELLAELERMMRAVDVATSLHHSCDSADDRTWARVHGHLTVLETFARHFRQYQHVLDTVAGSIRTALDEQFVRQEAMVERLRGVPPPPPPKAPPPPPPPPQLRARVAALEQQVRDSEQKRVDEVAAAHSLFSREIDELQAQMLATRRAAAGCAACSVRSRDIRRRSVGLNVFQQRGRSVETATSASASVSIISDGPLRAAEGEEGEGRRSLPLRPAIKAPRSPLRPAGGARNADADADADADPLPLLLPKGSGEDVPVHLRSERAVRRLPLTRDAVVDHILAYFLVLEEDPAADPREAYTAYLNSESRSPEDAVRLAYTIDAAAAEHPDVEDFMVLAQVLEADVHAPSRSPSPSQGSMGSGV